MFKGRMLWAWQGWAMPGGRCWGFCAGTLHHVPTLPSSAGFVFFGGSSLT